MVIINHNVFVGFLGSRDVFEIYKNTILLYTIQVQLVAIMIVQGFHDRLVYDVV